MIELHEANIRPLQLSPTDVAGVAVADQLTDGGEESPFARMLDQQLDRHVDPNGTQLRDIQPGDRLTAAETGSSGARAVAVSIDTRSAATVEEAATSRPLAQLIDAIEKLVKGARSLALREGDEATARARAGLEGLLAELRGVRDLAELEIGGLLSLLGGPGLPSADSATVGALMEQARTALTSAVGTGLESEPAILSAGLWVQPADRTSPAPSHRALATSGSGGDRTMSPATLSAGPRVQLADRISTAPSHRVLAASGSGGDGPMSPDAQLPRETQISRDSQGSRVVVVDLRDGLRGALGAEGKEQTPTRGVRSRSTTRVGAAVTAAQPAASSDGLAASAPAQSAEGTMRASPVFDVVALRPQQTTAGDVTAPFAAEGSRLGDLRSLLPSEVVRHTNILVREGGGEIRLVLRPESLGSVRINVSIENGSLEGRILVENASVREVIENNLGSLRAALRDEGFEDAALDVSVGERGTGGQRRKSDQASEQAETGGDSTTYRVDAADDADGGYRFDDHGGLAINLVV